MQPFSWDYIIAKYKNEISQDDKYSYISTFIKTIYRGYENQSYNRCTLYKTRLQLVFIMIYNWLLQSFRNNCNSFDAF